jgi:type VI secretion system protein ImpI
MALRFSLVNEQTLPDGGPVSFTVSGERSVDIGRDRHLDWTLPDPTRLISGKHCEVHYRDGGYWLHDVSTNGTFLNGSQQRMGGPHRLRDGDRVVIGHYVIDVALDADKGVAAGNKPVQAGGLVSQQHADYQELWTSDRDVPPPIDPQQLKIAREAARPVNPGFLDWAAAVPEPDVDRFSRPLPRTPEDKFDHGDMSWAAGALNVPKQPEPAPVVPSPRRPLWADEDLSEHEPPQPASVEPHRPPAETPSPYPAAMQQRVAPSSAAKAPGAANGDVIEFARHLAKAAGLPENFFAGKDSAELGEQFGTILRLTVENLMDLLQARHQAKQMVRSTNQTMVQAVENNPLKFSPTAEDAMRILFGPATRSYLDAPGAFVQGFGDLKSHQLKTYMAMQHAVARLVASIDPVVIAREVEGDRGSAFRLGSGKSKLWDAYVLRWKAQLGRDGNAPIDAFMLHFASFYDHDGKIDKK